MGTERRIQGSSVLDRRFPPRWEVRRGCLDVAYSSCDRPRSRYIPLNWCRGGECERRPCTPLKCAGRNLDGYAQLANRREEKNVEEHFVDPLTPDETNS